MHACSHAHVYVHVYTWVGYDTIISMYAHMHVCMRKRKCMFARKYVAYVCAEEDSVRLKFLCMHVFVYDRMHRYYVYFHGCTHK